MDSLSQAVLGATVAGAVAGKRCNAKVLLTGAALGTLPDLDVIIDYGDAVQNTIQHRGFTHSLLLLPPFALLISWLYCRWKPDSFWTLGRVFALTLGVLVTHPLLDAMTTYGTQLLWPFEGYFSVSNIFIIDPLYTLPLLIAFIVSMFPRINGGKWCTGALILSTLYLGWGYAAQQITAERVEQNIAQYNLPNKQVLITPTPFNTLLWRIVIMGEETYLEGVASLLDSDSKIDFTAYPLQSWPLEEQPKSLLGLKKFSHDFLKYRVEEQSLIVSDLRMGLDDQLSFEFILAEKADNDEWNILETTRRYPSERSLEKMGSLWQRLKGN